MKLTLKKKIGAAATAVAIVGGAGIASAYWTSTGTGAGSATAGSDTAWVVTTGTNGALVHPALTPAGPTDVVDVHVKNAGTGVQGLNTVTIKVANADGTAWSVAGCDASDFSIGGGAAGSPAVQTQTATLNLAENDVHDTTVTVQMVNKPTTSQNGCRGVTVPLHVSAA